MVIKLLYKDGTHYDMIVRVPPSVGDQISAFHLVAVNVYCEPVFGAADDVPRLEDFIKKAGITGMEIKRKGG